MCIHRHVYIHIEYFKTKKEIKSQLLDASWYCMSMHTHMCTHCCYCKNHLRLHCIAILVTFPMEIMIYEIILLLPACFPCNPKPF